jgi:DNA-binding MarR family transcriptional regulator
MSSRSKNSISSVETTLFVSLLRIADTLAVEAEQVVKTAGLTGAQYNVLRILRGAGREGLACREIGERMISRDPDITRLLDRMEKRDLITRERQTDDRRVVRTCVTANGLELLKNLDQPIRELHKRQFDGFSAPQLKVLVSLLDKIRERQTDGDKQTNSQSDSSTDQSHA